MARTTCKQLLITRIESRHLIRRCGLSVPIGVKTICFDPVEGALVELDLCQDHQDAYLDYMVTVTSGAHALTWPRDKPIRGADGTLWRATGVRAVLKAAGITDLGKRGALSDDSLSKFEAFSPEKLRDIIKENPELMAEVLNRAFSEDAMPEPADLASDV
jgi:hypothetical protein